MQVDALRDQAVSRVACGAWHTAVIASPLPDGADSLDGLSFIERIALQHKLAAMYELTQEVRLGQLSLSCLTKYWRVLGRARFSQRTDTVFYLHMQTSSLLPRKDQPMEETVLYPWFAISEAEDFSSLNEY